MHAQLTLEQLLNNNPKYLFQFDKEESTHVMGLCCGSRRPTFLWTLLLGFFLLLLGLIINTYLGSADIPFVTVWEGLFYLGNTNEMLMVQEIRLPRALVAVLIGASLAVAGAVMQAITRNPLANPQMFGVNAGASLVVVVSTILWPQITQQQMVYSAFIGAALGGLMVYFISAGGAVQLGRLAIAGMTVHFLLASITQGFILFNENTTDSILYWLVGSIENRDWKHVKVLFPWSIVGLTTAFVASRSLTLLSMGDDVAQGLGICIATIRFVGSLLIIVLAGSAVSVAGPIGFIGLLIPHCVRLLVGVDCRYILPCSALYGAVLLVYADIASRYIVYPYQSPVGIVTAMLGTPFFLYLAYKGAKRYK